MVYPIKLECFLELRNGFCSGIVSRPLLDASVRNYRYRRQNRNHDDDDEKLDYRKTACGFLHTPSVAYTR